MNIGQLTYKYGNFFGYQKSNMAATSGAPIIGNID